MRFKMFTFMVVPPDSSKVRKINLPSHILLSIILLLILVFGFVGYVIYDYTYVIGELQSIKHIKIRNRKLAQQLRSYKVRIDEIEDSLERLKVLTTKLKIISNLRDPERYPHQNLPSSMDTVDDIDDLSMRSDVEVDNQFRNMRLKLREIEYKISFQEEELNSFNEYLADQSALLAATPSIWPVRGWVTSNFGPRVDPFTRKVKHHDGLDIGTRINTVIVAPADGIVTFTGTKPGYGYTLVIDHGYGISTRYAHNSRFYVSQGTKVKRGLPICAVGNTGRSTGPHLHYEVRINGVPVDPKRFILDNPWE
ncbi:MAG: M23 family metallopeptidase [Oligoflexia bacterium]|nr:M23 family metallopeptidase [Oligoflexia bacterium]